MRVGNGVDVHAFAADRPLWLGCIEWPDQVGLEGHSDGDAVAHAICDSLFAAAGLGDMGSNFGTDRPEFSGARGAEFLAEAAKLVKAAGFSIVNISVQVVGKRPKIASRRAEMETAISQALGGAIVSVAGTTTDGLGYEGRGEGVAVYAVCLLND